nr:helix-turn-helix transcriptional regulator [uncultured Acetatifactor sp.]
MIDGLGKKLLELRQASGQTRKEVAPKLDISVSVLANYENDIRTPSLEVLKKLAEYYHCSADYLLDIDKTGTAKMMDVSMLNDKQYQLLQALLQSVQE